MTADPAALTCPLPRTETERVLLGHGSGGQLSNELLHDVLVPAVECDEATGPLEDAAVFHVDGLDLVMSTDSFVVSPLVFPGGDIGSLAVHGTVNDVAMMGGTPVALSLAFVVEEGLPLETLREIAESAGRAAREAGVPIRTGDTKVVGRGAADGLFVTTTGLGWRMPTARLSAGFAQPGDVVLLSGPVGLHGTTILSVREGLGFESSIASDSRALHGLVHAMISHAGHAIHTLRDPTRGGLASALNEIARDSGVGVVLDDTAVPVPPAVAAACEMLGLDPLHVANEGCLVAFVAPEIADEVLEVMRSRPEGAEAVRIGTAVSDHPGRVVARTLVGSTRIVDMLIGEQLPRIC